MGELRKDPILGRWVIIATERSKRPGSFFKESGADQKTDPLKCPFCIGHESMTPPEIYSIRDPKTKADTPGWKVRVVPNKFPALGIDHPLERKGKGVFDKMTGFGAHEVVIETPDHERESKDQSIEEITSWISAIQFRADDLTKDKRFRYILIFKNKGFSAGASLSHPHHQIIATPVTPKRVKEELAGSLAYFKLKERCIFCDIIDQELSEGERIVYENDTFVSFCPYVSRFPYEIWVLPKKHIIDFYDSFMRSSINSFAEHLKIISQKLASILGDPEYNYIIHSSPNRFARPDYWKTIENDYHLHLELLPRLTRVAGFEWGTGFYINPVSPEQAAKELREAKIG
ncbi:MAG: galactose-1-phosphate uridylyltransferase [Candidatus Omnitrophica bacterium]|nr:galactose-1-phosphate uridylyltransferase [Candidatus Omnitrophota bacterium]